MNTLILREDDEAHKRAFKEDDIKNLGEASKIEPITTRLQVIDNVGAALGDAASLLGMAYFSQIARKIVNFGSTVMETECKKPARPEVAEFQIIVAFHQTSRRLAEEITKAFQSLPQDQSWKNLPKKCDLELRVRRIWLLSCESGGDRAGNANLSPKYANQAKDMRIAAAKGFKRELVAPSSKPPQFWYPYVYDFSTGDIIHGSLTLSPTHVSFRTTPNWEVDAKGDILYKDPGPPKSKAERDPDYGSNSDGTIYQFDSKTQTTNSATLAAGTETNILKNPLHDIPQMGP